MKMVKTEHDAFERGVDLFNQSRYFEAHEAWEGIWLTAGDPAEKRFFQGLIMAAGAFLHYQKRECAGASTLLLRSIELLESMGSGHRELRLPDFIAALRALRDDFSSCSFSVPMNDLPRIHRSEVVQQAKGESAGKVS